MAVRSSMALEDPPAAEEDDFLAFLVGRLDDMVMIAGIFVTGCLIGYSGCCYRYYGKTAMVKMFMFMSHVNR